MNIISLHNINNARFNPSQVIRDNNEVIMYEENGEVKALASIQFNYFGLNECYIAYITSAEKSYGARLLQYINNEYDKVVLMCAPRAEHSLCAYYRKQNMSEIMIYSKTHNNIVSFFYKGIKGKEIRNALNKKYNGEKL